tara:strand:+ start:633 stop:797 length:165 start_codon:yes stop_codon:yes gene_type:complete
MIDQYQCEHRFSYWDRPDTYAGIVPAGRGDIDWFTVYAYTPTWSWNTGCSLKRH